MKKNSIFYVLILFLAPLIWGCAFVFQDIGNSYIGPFTFSVIRCLIGSTFLLILSLILYWYRKKKGIPSQDKSFKYLLRSGCITGVFTAIGVGAQQFGMVGENAGKAGFITALYIIFVPIFAFIIFRKKTNFLLIIAVILALVGLYFINVTDGGSFSFTWNTVLLLVCALGFTFQILFIDRYSPNLDPIHLSCVQFYVAAILLMPFMFIMEHDSTTAEGFINALPSLLFTGIMSIGVAFTIQIYAQSKVNVVVACCIMSLESVFSVIFSIIILKETYTATQLVGCLLIFIGVILSQIPLPSKKKL